MLDYKELVADLNIDEGTIEETTIKNLLASAEELCYRSINTKDYTKEYFEKDELFKRASYAEATHLYYNRDMTDSLPKGILMLLIHLKAGLKPGEVGDKNGTEQK